MTQDELRYDFLLGPSPLDVLQGLVTGNTGNKSISGNTGSKSISGNTGSKSISGNIDSKSISGNTGSKNVSGNTSNEVSKDNNKIFNDEPWINSIHQTMIEKELKAKG